MLFEPGPLALFTDDEIPTPGLPISLASESAPEILAIGAGARALVDVGNRLAVAAADVDDGGAAGDVAEAAAAIAAETGDPHPEIAGAAAGADVLEGDLGALASELLGDLSSGEPPQPQIPPGTEPDFSGSDAVGAQTGPPPDTTVYEDAPIPRRLEACFGPACATRYRQRLAEQIANVTGRLATSDELLNVDRYMGTYGYLDDDALDWLWANWVQPNL
jgi:hypothetical protein